VTIILIWLGLSCIAAPFVGRFLAGLSDVPPGPLVTPSETDRRGEHFAPDAPAGSSISHTHKIEG